MIIDLEPGALREIHWHPDAEEGEARMMVFDVTANARTFNYRAGDVGYYPKTLAHYIENTGTERMQVINVFKSPRYSDLSLNQWMTLTPPDLVRGTLDLGDTAMKALRREYRPVVRYFFSPGIRSPRAGAIRAIRGARPFLFCRVELLLVNSVRNSALRSL